MHPSHRTDPADEELDDVAAFKEAKRRLAAGEDEMVPAAFANRLLDGENPIRVWREYRGLTVSDLARRADLSQSYVSQIETGRREGSVSALRAIADVLGLTIDDLVGRGA